MDVITPGNDRAAALAFLYDRIDYERNATAPRRSRGLDLGRMRDLLERLGNPQQHLPVVHLAGTNGKGSTAAMIASVLSAAGYRTGLYTSPHLERLEERFVVAGEACSAGELVELVELVRPVVLQMDRQSSARGPTFFEITTAIGWLHFVRKSVDVVVLEVGMGGRLDSTNICRPLVTVITSIGLDHTRQLGGTLAAIAGEKAGIIKPGVPVVSGVCDEEPADTLAQVARRQGCRLIALDRDFGYEYQPPARTAEKIAAPQIAASVRYRKPSTGSDMTLATRFLGRHQAANVAVAVAAIEELQLLGWRISDEAIADGIATAHCPARIEVVAEHPLVIVDSAHNVAAIDALATVLDASFDARRRWLIFAASRGKNARGMLRSMLPRFDDVILTRYLDNPRAIGVEELAAHADRLMVEDATCAARRPNVVLCDDPAAAWRRCQSSLDADDLVCIAGSFFLAAELRGLVDAHRAVACR